MLSPIPDDIPDEAPVQSRYASTLRGIDILGQLILLYLAWTTLRFAGAEDADNREIMLRMPVVLWQIFSLVISAIAYEGHPERQFHRRAIWPVLGSLLLCAVLIPFGIGEVLLRVWFGVAMILSVPYFIVTVVTAVLQLESRRRDRKPFPVPQLFILKQADLIAQLLSLAIPLLITLASQRPIHEALVLAYPFLAGLQLVSAAGNAFTWTDMQRWHSGLRIPQMVIQVVFGLAILIHWMSDRPFHWRSTFYEPCAQILVAAYLLITYHEWEKLSAGLATHRRTRIQSITKPQQQEHH